MRVWMVDQKQSCVLRFYNYLLKDFVHDPVLQTLLNTDTCRAHLTFNHLFDQLLAWFVYVNDPPLLIQQPPKFLRQHVSVKVKALGRRECLGNGLGEFGGMGRRKHDLNNRSRADEAEPQ